MIAGEDAAREWMVARWDAAAMDRLDRLAMLLIEANTRQNLVAASSLSQIWQRHFVDSAQLLAHVPRGTSPWLDLGTGAGFPGLVVAICAPDSRITLVESRRLRVEWLAHAVDTLGLENVEIAGARLEDVPARHFAAISARAFAPLPRLFTLAARFSTAETHWLLPKGRSARQELSTLKGWRHALVVRPSLTDAEAGIVVGHLLGRKGKIA